ncbi:MAG: hypothetical protein HQK96_09780 [Nitrospirae bacterium]|nr:hypothetical protein [Nitrospirota bacterium]
MIKDRVVTNQFKDRRKGPDFWKRFIPTMLIICWVLIWVSWTFVYLAMPQHKTIVDLHYDFAPRAYWDISLIDKAFITMNAMLLASVLGLMVNFFRHRRKTDKISRTLIFMLILSVGGIGFLFYRFLS